MGELEHGDDIDEKTDKGKAKSDLSDFLERKDVLATIEAEPELIGEPPMEMIGELELAMKARDIDLLVEVMRITVRLTKQGIRERVNAL